VSTLTHLCLCKHKYLWKEILITMNISCIGKEKSVSVSYSRENNIYLSILLIFNYMKILTTFKNKNNKKGKTPRRWLQVMVSSWKQSVTCLWMLRSCYYCFLDWVPWGLEPASPSSLLERPLLGCISVLLERNLWRYSLQICFSLASGWCQCSLSLQSTPLDHHLIHKRYAG
jgi:hypothetical protein